MHMYLDRFMLVYCSRLGLGAQEILYEFFQVKNVLAHCWCAQPLLYANHTNDHVLVVHTP